MNTPKYNYYYDEYFNDMATLYDRYVNRVNPHVVGVYRGSLPIATHLSNVLECPMSIIKFQSYDGNDKKAEWLLNLTEDKSDVLNSGHDLLEYDDQAISDNVAKRGLII